MHGRRVMIRIRPTEEMRENQKTENYESFQTNVNFADFTFVKLSHPSSRIMFICSVF